jgi:hypothetical protein
MEFDVASSNESPSLVESEEKAMSGDLSLFYRRRHRAYTGLLLFVVVVGLPIVGLPFLRNRLSARILMLKAAMAGEIKPIVAQVGVNREPFPAEYERPEPSAPQAYQLPPSDKVFTMKPGGWTKPPPVSNRAASKDLKSESPLSPDGSEEPPVQGEAASESSQESALKYQQGAKEQDAYDLLLQSNSTVAGMVHGSNPSLHFASWDAAYRGDDIYWVRLKFQSDDNPDREYIWQVKLGSKEIAPLSYYARSIS